MILACGLMPVVVELGRVIGKPVVKRMRAILRKLGSRISLEEDEYQQLLSYIETLRSGGEESYKVFRDSYGSVLASDYGVGLPRFARGRADLLEYLSANPNSLRLLKMGPVPLSHFPAGLRDYLRSEYGSEVRLEQVSDLVHWIESNQLNVRGLPCPRQGEPVLVYEDGNASKETGLAHHFNRIARHSFVSRIVSVRYLTRGKAAKDRFEVRGAGVLSGIYTNKEKSIYYLIYLTEDEPHKTANACRLLNYVFYG